jgi:hypothetical protein
VARDQLELERLKAAEEPSVVADHGNRVARPRSNRGGSKRLAAADTVLQAYGLTGDLHRAITDTKNGGDDADEA